MGAVNGVAAGLAVVGGVLLYAGKRNLTIADALRTILHIPNAGTMVSQPFGDVVSGLADYGPDIDGGNNASIAAGNASAAGVVAHARSQIGKPYKWAAVGPDAFDCSGLVYYCLKQSGFPDVPRFTTATFGTWAKANGFSRVGNPSQFAAGDIVVKVGHMGIMSGPGTMINAPHTGATVREQALWSPIDQWWAWRIGRGILTAPVGKRTGVPTSVAQEQAELRQIG